LNGRELKALRAREGLTQADIVRAVRKAGLNRKRYSLGAIVAIENGLGITEQEFNTLSSLIIKSGEDKEARNAAAAGM
jgi:transcriptional regulator with XRE-family HTH domain